MSQENEWEREYQNPKLVTKDDKPQSDVLNFLKYLKKEQSIPVEGLRILDLGCGTGRNSNYLASIGNTVIGYEISETALRLGEERAKYAGISISIEYKKHDIGSSYPIQENSIDLILDITSSNSLSEAERAIYLKESARVLKQGGWFFVKGLCKDGDTNAKHLIKTNPGKGKDTYILPEIGITERVFSKQDFIDLYSPFFKIVQLTKKTNYTRMEGRSYKRNFWLAYMKK